MRVILLLPNGLSLDPQKPKMLKQLELEIHRHYLYDMRVSDMFFISNESEEIFLLKSETMKLQLKASEEGWYKKVQTVRTNGATIIYLKPVNIQSLASVPHPDGRIDYYDAKAHYDRHYGDPTQLRKMSPL